MMSLYTVLYLLFLHWVADFLFQTTEMGTQKSKSNKTLIEHTGTYMVIMFLGVCCIPDVPGATAALFSGVCFVCHTAQDYVTSRMTSKQFAKQKYNGWDGAFTIIGLDQLFHYVQILGTFYLLV